MPEEGKSESVKTSIQISPELRDRIFRLKFRRTYEQFFAELCDLYEEEEKRRTTPIEQPKI
jgi:hypothetical protein